MQLTFIFIGIISLLVLIYSVRLFIRQLKLKEIVVFDLIERTKSFEIVESGIHSICIFGLSSDFTVSELKVSLSTPNGKEINLTKNKIRYSYLRKGIRTFEQWSFKAHHSGTHKLNLKNLEEFLSKNPFLTSQKPFSNRKTETKSLKILVKQSVSTKHRLISIIGLVLGVNGLFWGIIMGINPNIFE